jgi:Zn-dependent protease
VYAAGNGLEFAVGFVLLIFIHEMGHALVLYMKGIKSSAPIFIPFIGAFITMKDLPKDVEMEAQVGMGGPLIGTIGAIGMFGLYYFTHHEMFLFLAFFGFVLNLFNLMPISPMDGGRIAAAISTKIWIFGLIMLLGSMFWFRSPMIILILFMAIVEIISSKKRRKEHPEYYNIPMQSRVLIGLSYFLLIAFLGFATMETHSMLELIKK